MGCKVDTLIERHALTVPDPGYDSIDEYLVARWTGSDGRSADGYKSLTEWFNKRLLKQIYETHGRDTVRIHLDREYEIVSSEESIHRAELAADLESNDLTLDRIESEMISWSTMRHHLKGCLDAKKEQSSASTDWEANTVRMSQERTKEKTHSVLSSLTSKGRLPEAESMRVDVQVKLGCPECAVRVPFEDALERGYVCETHSESESGEPVSNEVSDRASSIALPYGILESLQAAALENPFVIETVVAPILL
ncbi:rod-determining factor RdfA [Halocatena marina]|uniref:Rod-determining factor RdfA n=1 Tax=Halocatena marina TaxID=2934937 RepID=A0ABD5YKK9_9EURY|nr:rod-determining factor RdfA [Halocatena marina]